MDDMYKDKSLKSLADRLLGVHRMGQQLGMRMAFILFKQEEKSDAT